MNRKSIIIIVSIVVLIGIGIFLYSNYKSNQPPESVRSKPADFPLHYGQTSEEIRKVQQVLNSKFNAGLVEDGVWGDNMENAMLKYIKYDSIDEPRYYRLINDKDYLSFLYDNYIQSIG